MDNEDKAKNVIDEAGVVYWDKVRGLPTALRRLSFHDLRTLFNEAVVPSIGKVRELDRESSRSPGGSAAKLDGPHNGARDQATENLYDELGGLEKIAEGLNGLSRDQKARMLTWAADKFLGCALVEKPNQSPIGFSHDDVNTSITGGLSAGPTEFTHRERR